MGVQHVIVGGKYSNPALLKTSIDPVSFGRDVGVAIKSIYYGALSSINMIVKLKHNNQIVIFPAVQNGRNRLDIFRALMKDVERVALKLKLSDSVFLKFERVGATAQYNIQLGEGMELVETPTALDATYGEDGILFFENKSLLKSEVVDQTDITIGFIYLNVVEWNFLNGMKSRLLAVAPFKHDDKYNHFEWEKPSYAKLDVNQFAYLEVSIRNLKGELIPFSSFFDTVVTLDIAQL